MNTKEILIELVEKLYEHETENKGQAISMASFLGYLNAQEQSEKPNELEIRKMEGSEEAWIQTAYSNPSQDISILLVLMYRYAKGYVKKALKDSVVQTADEFSFLITLLTYESMTKTELINKQVMEKTSGAEVIKRLLNQQLLEEFADPDDRRSVRVAITERGRNEILALLPEMDLVSKIVVGNLNDSEIKTLAYLLKKLDYYHNDIFLHHKNESLDSLKNNRL